MSHTTLENILEALKTLETDELRQIEDAVQDRLYPSEEAKKREAFYAALVTSGLVKEITHPVRTSRHQRLAQVSGKPVSETIIEERR